MRHFKSSLLRTAMLLFNGNYAPCGTMASIHEQSVWKLSYLIILSQLPTSFGDVGFENKVAVAHAHISFQKKCSGLSARWIMMALWVPNVHHHSNIWFWQCYFVREWRTWEIIKGFYLGKSCLDLCGSCIIRCTSGYLLDSFLQQWWRWSTKAGSMKHIL